jgi:hypothetical protein
MTPKEREGHWYINNDPQNYSTYNTYAYLINHVGSGHALEFYELVYFDVAVSPHKIHFHEKEGLGEMRNWIEYEPLKRDLRVVVHAVFGNTNG